MSLICCVLWQVWVGGTSRRCKICGQCAHHPRHKTRRTTETCIHVSKSKFVISAGACETAAPEIRTSAIRTLLTTMEAPSNPGQDVGTLTPSSLLQEWLEDNSGPRELDQANPYPRCQDSGLKYTVDHTSVQPQCICPTTRYVVAIAVRRLPCSLLTSKPRLCVILSRLPGPLSDLLDRASPEQA
jgi:hypothetical protein